MYTFVEDDQEILTKIETLLPSRYPLAFIGAECSGRSTFAKYYSQNLTGESPITLSIQSAQDAKDIFGQYTCGQVPGEFVFHEGILVNAIRTGRVVLLKNVDDMQIDVFSAISDILTALIDNQNELVMNMKRIQIHNKFRVVITCKPGSKLMQTCFGIKFIQLEIQQMNNKKVKTLIEFYLNKLSFQQLLENMYFSKILTLKQTIKLCKRLKYNIESRIIVLNDQYTKTQDLSCLTLQNRFIILQEIFDVKLAQLCVNDQFKNIQALSQQFKIDPFQITEYYYKQRFDIGINMAKQTFKAGRFEMQRLCINNFNFSTKNFAMTNYTTRLIQQIAGCYNNKENCLLIASTGIGKTYTLDMVAKAIGNELLVINFSSQTEISDLTGGYKPVNETQLIREIYQNTSELANKMLDMSVNGNKEFIIQLSTLYLEKNQIQLVKLSSQFLKQLLKNKESALTLSQLEDINQTQQKIQIILEFAKAQTNFFFKYRDGILINAIKQGKIILLDEINLAPNEVLQYLESILSNDEISIVNQQTNQDVIIQKHPNFRVFASMNPATDAGKKQLPQNLQEMFTILNLEEMTEYVDLRTLVENYLQEKYNNVQNIVELFIELKKLSISTLKTTIGLNPTYSIRLLCRALKFVLYHHQSVIITRALYDGFHLYFTSNLDLNSTKIAVELIRNKLEMQKDFVFQQFKPQVQSLPFLNNEKLVNVIDNIYFPCGPQFDNKIDIAHSILENQSKFVITDTNAQYIKIILKALLCNTAVLLEGVTSSGKSSLILFLAQQLGYNVTRINNHENVDLQDYLGSFQPDSKTGQLVFKYGPLVQAMKNGQWVILDELNLCSSEILESLNRLLDDNAELYIPETNEVIKPQPGFALFATQNPSGLINGQYYGGRKQLSEAFKNRFICMEISEISTDELKFILQKRQNSKNLPERFIDSLINTIQELKIKLSHSLNSLRSDLVSQQITLRDLFRIADRLPSSIEELAIHIFMCIGEKQRSVDLKVLVINIIKKNLQIEFSLEIVQQYYYCYCQPIITMLKQTNNIQLQKFSKIVFTNSFMRLYACTMIALRYLENPCLVGECGSGKTQVAELCAAVLNLKFSSMNLHKNTDVSDLLGQLRPIRNRNELQHEIDVFQQLLIEAPQQKFYIQRIEQIQNQLKQLFKWYDGPLIEAMQKGSFLLLDEISLANDAILERLNSVFETTRELTIAEKPDFSQIKASNKFRIVSTMNPGGDYGKKELSPALRNRMTEIYVEAIQSVDEIKQILLTRGQNKNCNGIPVHQLLVEFFKIVIELSKQYYCGQNFTFSIRDLVGIYDHLQYQFQAHVDINENEFLNVLQLCFTDGLQIKCGNMDHKICTVFQKSIIQQMKHIISSDETQYDNQIKIAIAQNCGLQFIQNKQCVAQIPFGPHFAQSKAEAAMKLFNLNAPTTAYNALRIAYSITNITKKPVLMESSPGVGKTSLIQQLANICGYELVRVNLSEHIDLSDLVGQELPCDDDNSTIKFQFVYGPVLRAIKNDCWLLLDEINLASQSVLEGLNSLLDYRRELYVPEINNRFVTGENFRIFGAQNPYSQGGSRKQLPQSFLNRFINIYLQDLIDEDYLQIISTLNLSSKFQDILTDILFQFQKLCNYKFGFQGGVWEINLRDIYRVYDGLNAQSTIQQLAHSLLIVFCYRFRCVTDLEAAFEIICNVFLKHKTELILKFPQLDLVENNLQCGTIKLPIYNFNSSKKNIFIKDMVLIEAIMYSIQQHIAPLFTTQNSNTPMIQRVLEGLSYHLKQNLVVMSLSLSTDTTDLIGQFEQISKEQIIDDLISKFKILLQYGCCQSIKEQYNELVKQFSIEVLFEDCVSQIKNLIILNYKQLEESNKELTDEILILIDTINDQKFVWQDGIITRAVQNGTWVYIQNVNYCQASVLDRLNSLLERNGCLIVYEQGKQELRVVKIHENFRVFLSYDTQYGEISRAIRNRCLEISIDNFDTINSKLFGEQAILDYKYDNSQMIFSVCEPNFIKLFQGQKLLNSIGQDKMNQIIPLNQIKISNKLWNMINSVYKSDRIKAYQQYCNEQDQLSVFISHKVVGNEGINELKECIKNCDTNIIMKIMIELNLMPKSELNNMLMVHQGLNGKNLDITATSIDLLIDKSQISTTQIRNIRSIITKMSMEKQISTYTKNLLLNLQEESNQNQWNLIRIASNLSNFCVTEENRSLFVNKMKKIDFNLKDGLFEYQQQCNIVKFCLYDQDVLHFTMSQISNKSIVFQMFANILLSVSHFNSIIKSPKTIFDIPITKYCCNLLQSISTTTASVIHSKQEQLKDIYNILIQRAGLIMKEKNTIIKQILQLQQRIINLNPIEVIQEDNEYKLGLKQAICIFNLFNIENQIDPAQHKQNQLIALQNLTQDLESQIATIKELQIFVESRIQNSYIKQFDVYQAISQLLSQFQQQSEEIKLQAINRQTNSSFFYEIQTNLQAVQILKFEQISKKDSKEQILLYRQMHNNIIAFVFWIQTQSIDEVLQFADVIIPILFALTSILFFNDLIVMEIEQKPSLDILDNFNTNYFGVNDSIQLRSYLLKVLKMEQSQIDNYIINSIDQNKQQISFQNAAQIAAAFESEKISTYVNLVNENSPYRSRLQSKTSMDNEEDLQRQINQVFHVEDNQLQKIMNKKSDSEIEQFLVDPDVEFIQNFGRLLISQLTNNCYEIPSVEYNQIQSVNKIVQCIAQKEKIFDHQNYILILDQLKRTYNYFVSETTVMAKVKSHNKRRSEVCKSIYKTPYPGEIYNFIGKIQPIVEAVQKLEDEFKENEKLQQILLSIQLFKDFQLLNQPLSKALAIVEQIQVLINEWNCNAPQSYKIQDDMLKQQVVYWRRIELMSWNTFFDDIQNEQHNIALVYWPELYLGALTAAGQSIEQFSQYKKDFEEQFKLFLYDSDIGQFRIRRDLIKSIAMLISQTDYQNVQAIVRYLIQLYNESYYLDEEINSYIQQQQQGLISQFTAQVKLFQWDERNFVTLREDTKKSHKQVMNILKKYNEIFQMKTVQVLKSNKQIRNTITINTIIDEEYKANQNQINAGIFDYSSSQRNIIFDSAIVQLLSFHEQKQLFNHQQFTLKNVIQSVIIESGFEDFTISYNNFDQIQNYFVNHNTDIKIIQLGCSFQRFLDQLGAVHHDVKQELPQIQKLVNALIFQIVSESSDRYEILDWTTFKDAKTVMIKISSILLTHFKTNQEIENELMQIQKTISQMSNLTAQNFESIQTMKIQLINIVNKLKQPQIIFSTLLNLLNTINIDSKLIDQEYYIGIQYETMPIVETKLIKSTILIYARNLIEMFTCILKNGYLCKQANQEQKEQKQQQPQQGTGLDDGQAEKDITEQVKEENMDEDDLIGNDKEQKEKEQDENDKDNGIDMEQDFGGQLQDIEENEDSKEEQQEDEEMDKDLGENINSDKEELDQREADEDEKQNNAENQEQQQKNQENLVENQENEESNVSNQDKEEVDVKYEDPDQNLENFEEIQEQNVSMQTQNEEDVNLSDLFNEVFEEELKKDDMEDLSDIEQIEEVEQKFDEKPEVDEQISEIDQEEIKKEEVEYEDQEQQWNNEEEKKDEGFNKGQNKPDKNEEENSQHQSSIVDDQRDDQQPDEQMQQETKTDIQQKNNKDNKNSEKINKQNLKQQLNTEEIQNIEAVNNEKSGDEDKVEANPENALLDENNTQQLLVDIQGDQEKQQQENQKETDMDNKVDVNNVIEEKEQIQLPQHQQQYQYLLQDQQLSNHSNILAERLKILLEPTLSSQMIGDFRSGKKLNMKKIIPFIASNFRKDKIWLRRTKPSKRTYKLVICVDNSFSIQNSQIIEQILNSLFIIFRACKNAELGKISICKFGSEFEEIYKLQDVFNDQLFVNQLERMTFNDKTTNFTEMFEGVLSIFENEPPSDKLDKIVIVLTDGQINDIQKVGELYRNVIQQKILPIFLLYNQKIFDQQVVQFLNQDGKRKIVKKLYLEDYPVGNYVVCTQENLIDALCSALVQFLQQVM